MDLDIDMGDAVDAGQEAFVTDQPSAADILQPDEPEEDGEIAEDEPPKTRDDDNDLDAKTVIPSKVHIRGLDTLHTDDIKAYIQAHHGPVDRVEWIDDTSANLVFSSEGTARDALVALSSIDIADVTALPPDETLPAKPIAEKPELSLSVRLAVLGDRKQAGAAQRSRYYLLHPEHDPEERRRKQRDTRSRYRDRDGEYRRDGGGGGRRRRRDSDEEAETFEASMYDDAPRETRARRRSDSGDRRRLSHANENRGKELFAGRSTRRDRSASPLRDGDGDQDMDGPGASSARNRTQARSIRDRISTTNRSKELFPSKSSSSITADLMKKSWGGGQLDRLEDAIGSARLQEEDLPKVVAVPDEPRNGGAFNIRGLAAQRRDGNSGFAIKGAAAAANAKELFPTKLGGSNVGKELFDAGRSKRRQKAEDLFG